MMIGQTPATRKLLKLMPIVLLVLGFVFVIGAFSNASGGHEFPFATAFATGGCEIEPCDETPPDCDLEPCDEPPPDCDLEPCDEPPPDCEIHPCDEHADGYIDIEKYTLVEAAPTGGDDCETVGKPVILTIKYTGDANPTSHTQDGGKVDIVGSSGNSSPVQIIATDKSDPSNNKAKIWFSSAVSLGGTFDVDATSIGRSKLSSNTYILVYDGSTLLQSIKFHTSCSQPLNLGDQFGSAEVVGFVGENGTALSPSPAPSSLGYDADAAPGPQATVGDTIVWSYVVTNTGGVILSDVAVTDDQGVSVTCPKTVLVIGESMTCTGTGTAVAGQYANIGATEGTGPHGWVVTDEDPSHYYADAQPIELCSTYGKPQVLTMLYTGGSTISNTQGGKAQIKFDAPLGSAQPVRIIANDKDKPFDSKAKVWFDSSTANVNLNDTFSIDSTSEGQSRLKSETRVHVLDSSNVVLQTVKFHTSCSQPLNLGDQFGSSQVVGFLGENGSGTP